MNKGTRILGIAASLSMVLAVGGMEPVSARNRKKIEFGTVEIILRVYDYVHMERPALVSAEGEATEILGQAGLESRWVDCPTSLAEIANYPDCQSELGADDLVIRVLPKSMGDPRAKGQDTLGVAYESDGDSAFLSNVFYDRVVNLGQGASSTVPVLLGRAMAHELGHLLLGTHSHSSSGIMRAFWSGRDLSLDGRIEMLFTPDQSRQMKSRLAGRAQAWQRHSSPAQTGVEALQRH
jgi:hypothetical protein